MHMDVGEVLNKISIFYSILCIDAALAAAHLLQQLPLQRRVGLQFGQREPTSERGTLTESAARRVQQHAVKGRAAVRRAGARGRFVWTGRNENFPTAGRAAIVLGRQSKSRPTSVLLTK